MTAISKASIIADRMSAFQKWKYIVFRRIIFIVFNSKTAVKVVYGSYACWAEVGSKTGFMNFFLRPHLQKCKYVVHQYWVVHIYIIELIKNSLYKFIRVWEILHNFIIERGDSNVVLNCYSTVILKLITTLKMRLE